MKTALWKFWTWSPKVGYFLFGAFTLFVLAPYLLFLSGCLSADDFTKYIRRGIILTAPIFALGGIGIAIWRIKVSERDSDTQKRDVQSKSLHGAIGLLNSDKSYARQGALRALEAYIKVELDRDAGSEEDAEPKKDAESEKGAEPEEDTQEHIRRQAIFALIAGFIQARAPLGQNTTSKSDTAKKSGMPKFNSGDSNVDIRTAIAILRENYPRKEKDDPEFEVESREKSDNREEGRVKYVFDLSDSKFPADSDFSYSDLSPSNFSDSEMLEAVFEGAVLKGSNFVATDLSGADFKKADLSGAELDKANLSGAKLELAQGVEQDMLESAFGDLATSLPLNRKRPKHWHSGTNSEDLINHKAWKIWKESLNAKASNKE